MTKYNILPDKSHEETRNNETYLNRIKVIYDKQIVNIINGEKLKAFPLKSRTGQECPLFPLLVKTMIEFL
jgi:uncharacterized membrane protein YobD (UPF0266 family)